MNSKLKLLFYIITLVPLIVAHLDMSISDVSFWTDDSNALSCWECFNKKGKICHDNHNDDLYEYSSRYKID